MKFLCGSAEALANALGAKRRGNGWIVRCPCHDDKTPSLSITQGNNNRILLYDFGGCDPCDIHRTLASYSQPSAYINRVTTIRRLPGDEVNTKKALQIWKASRSITNSSRAQAYFKDRGLQPATSEALRFHPRLWHPSRQSFPGIVAKICDLNGNLLGIHRTFLSHEGVGKAPVDPKRMMLGNFKDGAVHFMPAGPILMIGEGIETCLTAMQATGLPTWAALSSSRLPNITLPECVEEVLILADDDDAGAKGAIKAGRRWKLEGRRVRIATPPAPYNDWNDMLMAKVAK